ncbi:MAG TPA: RNA methyltransferase [Candidatus Anaerotruncus excrementipullorum]|uniref:RNA methyltransferase n=1 Tax=Candidatus Anaerotruncus excrementipullorum TaxID=2838465 RepID=A0A9D2B7C4_9FIRM|nr:RNA methyltransferase [Candidatus Anaerotruncus excrementipullorum]
MREKEILSRENPSVKRYTALAASRAERKKQGLFITEGVKLTQEALQAGYPPVELLATREAWERAAGRLAPYAGRAESLCWISSGVEAKLADAVTPQGVFGVFRQLDKGAQPVTISSDGRYLLLESLQDPGNLGTVLRTAAAFGVDGVFLSPGCPDPFSPKVLRASMGGVFKLPVQIARLEEVLAQLAQAGVPAYAAALRPGALPPQRLPRQGGCAVVIGNEGNGLPQERIDQCGRTVMIPMEPGNESLNAAMAAGILLWELYRDRII